MTHDHTDGTSSRLFCEDQQGHISVTRRSSQGAGLVLNVRSYGATGNGVTEDTAAFQAAIAALNAAGGGILFIPPTQNFYKLSSGSPVLFSGVHNIIMQGVGRESSLKLVVATDTGEAIRVESDSSDIVIEDLAIECDPAVKGMNGIGAARIGLKQPTRLAFNRNYIHGFKAETGPSGGKGIAVETGVTDWEANNNWLDRNDFGIRIFATVAYPVTRWLARGNRVTNTTASVPGTGYAFYFSDSSADYKSWEPGHAYSLGDLVIPSPVNSYLYQCVKAGKSGESIANFSANLGASTSDNFVIWKTLARVDGSSAPDPTRVDFSGTATENVIDIAPVGLFLGWAAGVDFSFNVLGKIGGADSAAFYIRESQNCLISFNVVTGTMKNYVKIQESGGTYKSDNLSFLGNQFMGITTGDGVSGDASAVNEAFLFNRMTGVAGKNYSLAHPGSNVIVDDDTAGFSLPRGNVLSTPNVLR